MSQLDPIQIGLIAASALALLFLIMFLFALRSKKKVKETYSNQFQSKEEKLNHEHKEALEKARIEKKKSDTRHKEQYDSMLSSKKS